MKPTLRSDCIVTKRLKIVPVTSKELKSMIDAESDDGLKNAYSEMLASAESNPGAEGFCLPWRINLLSNEETIGSIGFTGLPVDGTAEIGYGLSEKRFEGQGYMTEAVTAMVRKAFLLGGLNRIEAEADAENKASIRVLEKSGFLRYGTGNEGPRFYIDKL